MTIVLDVSVKVIYFTDDTDLFMVIKLKMMGRAPDLSRMDEGVVK